MDIEKINEVSGSVVDAAIKVHTALGPGLLESAYEACLVYELPIKNGTDMAWVDCDTPRNTRNTRKKKGL